MADKNREIHELLVDYAGTLRDGCIPTFLKSLTREEARKISSSRNFWDAAEIVRILNGVGFADKVSFSEVSPFISRVKREMESRLKKAKALSRSKHGTHATPLTRR